MSYTMEERREETPAELREEFERLAAECRQIRAERDRWMTGEEVRIMQAEIERLRAALWDIHAICNGRPFALWLHHRIKKMARAALKGGQA